MPLAEHPPLPPQPVPHLISRPQIHRRRCSAQLAPPSSISRVQSQAMAVAAAMKKLGKGPAMLTCMLVLALAFMGVGKCTAGAAGDQAGGVLQTTYKDSAASALAFRQQSLFQCPCSNQFCDGNVFQFCSCNDATCSCDCHNAVGQTKVPGGATIQLRPTP